MARPLQGNVQLSQLSAEEFASVKQLLISGESPARVAKIIQTEFKKCLGITQPGLVRAIYRYRKDVLADETKKEIAKAVLGKSGEEYRKMFNAIDELSDLCVIQRTRVHKLYQQETKGPLLMGQVSKEVVTLANALRDLAYLQFEAGILVRVPRSARGVMVGSNGQVSAFDWTEEDARILQVIDAYAVDPRDQTRGS